MGVSMQDSSYSSYDDPWKDNWNSGNSGGGNGGVNNGGGGSWGGGGGGWGDYNKREESGSSYYFTTAKTANPYSDPPVRDSFLSFGSYEPPSGYHKTSLVDDQNGASFSTKKTGGGAMAGRFMSWVASGITDRR